MVTRNEHWNILVRLYERDGRSQQELSVCTKRDKPGATRLIDTMEKNALVVHKSDITDRRVNIIFLPDKARSLQQPLTEQVLLSLAETTGSIDAKSLAVCSSFLEKVRANLVEL